MFSQWKCGTTGGGMVVVVGGVRGTKILSTKKGTQVSIKNKYLIVISSFSHTMSQLDFDFSLCVCLNRWRHFQSWSREVWNTGGSRSPRRWRYSGWGSSRSGNLRVLKNTYKPIILVFFQVLCYLLHTVSIPVWIRPSKVLCGWSILKT